MIDYFKSQKKEKLLINPELVTGEDFNEYVISDKLEQRVGMAHHLISKAAKKLGFDLNSNKKFQEFSREFIVCVWADRNNKLSPHAFFYIDKQNRFTKFQTLTKFDEPRIFLFQINFEKSNRFAKSRQAVARYIVNKKLIKK